MNHKPKAMIEFKVRSSMFEVARHMSNLNFWGKLNKLRVEIKLDDKRKLMIRNYLISEINGAEKTNDVVHGGLGMSSWNRLLSGNYQKKYTLVFVSLVIAIILGGGVSFAAEGSLPGDALYPVKVNVNEQVRSSLTFGTQANAEWDARLATRRLEEAEQLTLKGKLNADTQVSIEKNFEEHSRKVTEGIAKFQSETNIMAAADLSSKFETSLSAHEQILRKLGDKSGPDVQSQSRKVEEKVKERLKSTSLKRSELDEDIASRNGNAEEQNNIKNAALGKITVAENVVNSLGKYINDNKDKISVVVVGQVETRIKTVRDLIAQAKVKVDGGAYGEAFNLAQKAIRSAQEVRVLSNASAELELNGSLIKEPDDGEFSGSIKGAEAENEAGINATNSVSSINKEQEEIESKSNRDEEENGGPRRNNRR